MKKTMWQRSLALGALMAFVITGSALAAEQYGIRVTKDDTTDVVVESLDDVSYEAYQSGVSVEGSSNAERNVQVIAPNILLDVVSNSNTTYYMHGLYAQDYGEISLGDKNTEIVNVNVNNSNNKTSNDKAIGIRADVHSNGVMILGENISIVSKANKETKSIYALSSVNIGSGSSESISLLSDSATRNSYGIHANNSAEVTLQGNEIAIVTKAGQSAYGSHANSTSKVTIGNSKTQNINISASSDGSAGFTVRGISNVSSATQTILGQSITIGIDNLKAKAYGIFADSSNETIIGDDNTKNIVVSSQTSSTSIAAAVYNQKDGALNITSDLMQLTANSAEGEAYAVKSSNNKKLQANITANDIQLYSKGNKAYGVQGLTGISTLQTKGTNGKITAIAEGTDQASGLFAQNDSAKIVIGNVDGAGLPDVTIKASTSGSTAEKIVAGITALYQGKIEVNAKTLDVETHADGKNWAYAVFAGNNTVDETGNLASVDIVADTINVTSTADTEGHASGLVAMSQGIMNIDGNLTVTADDAIVARGDAVMRVNEDGKHSTKLNGNINFNYDKASSGTKVDANILVNLTGVDSYWNGNTAVTWSRGENETLSMEDKLKVNNLKITLSDGAQWNPEYIKEEGQLTGKDGTKGSRYIALNNLNLNDGIVNVDVAKTQKQAIQVEKLGGSGGTLNFTVDKTGGALTTGTFKVFDGAEATQVDTNYVGITADDVVTKEKFKDLVQKSLKIGENSKAKFTAYVEEGLLTPAMSAVTKNSIKGNTIGLQNIQQGKTTTTMDSMRNVASTAIIAWRQEDSTLSQRLGELRNSEGGQGVWVRMSRGEFEYNGAFKNQYNYFQMGYDKAYGDWHYGAAISHNDGETTYANGKGDNRSTSLSLYGTWLGKHGQYADIVLKQGRLSNEFEIHAAAGDTRGDYDAWGTSLSGEYGVKMDMADGWYVTPQAQLTFMRIGGEDYTTSNNIRVSQDTLYSTVGRIGFELGKNITDKGSVYAKASLLHEFAGEADTYLRLGDLHNSYSQDIGNTWYEAGLGFNYKTGANSYVYADVVKTFGDDFKTPWQWNAGVRWSF